MTTKIVANRTDTTAIVTGNGSPHRPQSCDTDDPQRGAILKSFCSDLPLWRDALAAFSTGEVVAN